MPPPFLPPPAFLTEAGEERRIGVEIEFSDLSSEHAAALVAQMFGGTIEPRTTHAFRVSNTRFGTFDIELDSQYAHADAPPSTDENDDLATHVDAFLGRLQRDAAQLYGDIGEQWLPVEIVAPPIPISLLPELNRLIPALRQAGASGTDEGLLYAFATQFNVEAPALTASSIVSFLRAFMVLSDWLRQQIDLNFKRWLLPFAEPFPRSYALKVIDPGYDPCLSTLIDDYLEANPTRNRELDCLPLFAHIDAQRVQSAVEDARVKSRPTYHYRLPDTKLSDPAWSLMTEWERWRQVECLASEPGRLTALSKAYLDHFGALFPGNWSDVLCTWFGYARRRPGVS